jgi:TIR domain
MKVFLSHASQDKTVAESIAFSLRGRGDKVFLDRDSLPPGRTYDEQIESAINASESFIFLISPDSIAEGRYSLTELMFARRKWLDPNGRVLPVMVRKTPLEELPPYLRAVAILEPVGNITAETSSALHNMRPSSPGPANRSFWDENNGAGFIYKSVVSIIGYLFVTLSYSRFDVGSAFSQSPTLVGFGLSILILIGLALVKRGKILNFVTIPAFGWICFLFLNYLYLSTQHREDSVWAPDYLFFTFLALFVPSVLALSSATVLFRKDPATI